MANEKKTRIPEAGNTAELQRLRKELENSGVALAKSSDDLLRMTKERDAARADASAMKTSLAGAVERIKKLEAAANKEERGEDEVKEGWVTLASCPLKTGAKPLPVKTPDGIPIPRVIDEDGICIEEMPVATAINLLSEGSGFRRYLTGPVNSIAGKIRVGVYMKDVVYYRHRKNKTPAGYEFIRVVVEAAPKG